MLLLLATLVHAVLLVALAWRRKKALAADPGAVLNAFAPVRASAPCPFAKRARLLGCEQREANEVLRAAAGGTWDGCVVRVAAGDLAAFAAAVTELLTDLGGA